MGEWGYNKPPRTGEWTDTICDQWIWWLTNRIGAMEKGGNHGKYHCHVWFNSKMYNPCYPIVDTCRYGMFFQLYMNNLGLGMQAASNNNLGSLKRTRDKFVKAPSIKSWKKHWPACTPTACFDMLVAEQHFELAGCTSQHIPSFYIYSYNISIYQYIYIYISINIKKNRYPRIYIYI